MPNSNINLPDGETIAVSYAPKGAKPEALPPDVVPGNEPAVGRVQPGVPNPQAVAGDELQDAAPSQALPIDAPTGTPMGVARPGELLPEIPQEGGDPLRDYVPGDPLPEAVVTVEHPDGTTEGPFPVQVGNVDLGDDPDGDIAGYDGGFTPVATEAEPLVGARITSRGVMIGDELLPAAQLVQPVRIEAHDCAGQVQSVVATYLVAGVHTDADAVSLVEQVPHHECSPGCTCQLDGQQAVNIGMFNATKQHLRRFVLQRDRDDTGFSGTGVVAEGVAFTDGRAVVRWLGDHSSIVVWENMSDAMAVHGHGGNTRLRWLDVPDPAAAAHPDAAPGVR